MTFISFREKKKQKTNNTKNPPQKTVKRGITLGVPLKTARVFLKTRFHPARGRALRPAWVPGAAHPHASRFFDLWVLPWPASPAFPPKTPLSPGLCRACCGCFLRERDRFVKSIFLLPLTAPAQSVNSGTAKSPTSVPLGARESGERPAAARSR